MPRRTYAQVADVISLLPQQISEKLVAIVNPDVIDRPVTETNILEYLELATEEIDSVINAMYQVPLRRIKESSQDGTTLTAFPEPIVNCCAYIAASLLYQKKFSENQNPDTIPKYSEFYRTRANKYLDAIREGDTVLKGQRQLGRRYVRGESRDAPKTPWDKKPLGDN